MCNTKDLAVTKIEKLTAAMHRLAAVMEASLLQTAQFQPQGHPGNSIDSGTADHVIAGDRSSAAASP
ncbi:hypothetical protein SAMN05421763_103281 [[Luteovulum] sphaeroides subsp. megalophilum]|uniref:hypothetical protein n=1 Tax=Cereibacter sphaeroides TaxID=1063 RepID=UPI000B72A558|nr:hypothetical protein [Cereibacter sphaeroides]SNS86861.1 hypothetical protein SAMN05421763_103281 [[Luteovulum] sphaeroides subsp. megalophilum]